MNHLETAREAMALITADRERILGTVAVAVGGRLNVAEQQVDVTAAAADG